MGTFSFLASTNIIDYANLCGECELPEPDHSVSWWKFWREEPDHWYERGCYCAESGRCEVCVDKAIDYADHLRDVAKESGVSPDAYLFD